MYYKNILSWGKNPMISKNNILKLKTRQEIYSVISKNPGIHLSELSRRMNIPISTLNYHLIYLNKLDLVKEDKKDGYKRFYIKDEISTQDKKILSILRKKISCQIYIHMLCSTACSQVDICKELELSPELANYYIRKMLDLGIIEKAIVENGYIFPFPNKKKAIKKKPIGPEIFYILKIDESRLQDKIYKLLISNKDSLESKELIETFLHFLDKIEKIGLIGKKLEKNAKKKILEKKGKKNSYIILDWGDEFFDHISDFFKPFFAA